MMTVQTSIARRIALSFGIFLTAWSMAACSRAPTDATLVEDLSTYVESGYAPGLLDVVAAERLDHLNLPNFGSDRRTISFAADLRLKRDYDFGVWDQPNAASLTYLLGAHPTALSGLKVAGNKSGDILHVTGAVVYVLDGDHWRLESGAPAKVVTSALSARGRFETIEQWWRITLLTFREVVSMRPPTITEDLAPALISASARFARQSGGMSLASGPPGSEYWNVMQALANARDGNTVLNVATSGSRENLHLLRQNSVTAAVMRGDEAALAAAGEAPFYRDGTFPDLRAVASLFPEQIHVIVMAKSTIASVSDLYGKRVAIAAGENVALVEAGDVLRAHRVPLSALAAPPSELPLADALEALDHGEQDAVIVTAPAPLAGLRNFATSHAIRLLPLDADAVALMTSGTSNYIAMAIPLQTYPRQRKSIATVGVTALLVTTDRIPAPEVEGLLHEMFADVDFMGQGGPMGALIKPASARRGLTLPLHSGAEAFFEAISAQK